MLNAEWELTSLKSPKPPFISFFSENNKIKSISNFVREDQSWSDVLKDQALGCHRCVMLPYQKYKFDNEQRIQKNPIEYISLANDAAFLVFCVLKLWTRRIWLKIFEKTCLTVAAWMLKESASGWREKPSRCCQKGAFK